MLRDHTSERRSRISDGALAATFVGAGVLHFVKPEPYMAIMPPQLPAPRELVYASGVAEIVGGLGALSPRARPWAGLWLVALLIAVFPANVHHALAADDIPGNPFSRPALFARLPLQALLIAWVWRATDPPLIQTRRRPLGRTREAVRCRPNPRFSAAARRARSRR